MSVFLKVEIPNLDVTIFVGTYVHFSTLGTGVLPRPGRGTKLGILEPAHWLKHRVFIIPNNAILQQNGIVKTRDQSSCLSFVVRFFCEASKLHNWTMLTSKHPVPQVSAFNRFGSFWNHTSHLHNSAHKGAAIFTPLMFWARAFSARCPNMWLTWSSGTDNNIHMLL